MALQDLTQRIRELIVAGGEVILPPGEFILSEELSVPPTVTRLSGFGCHLHLVGKKRVNFLFREHPNIEVQGLRLTRETTGSVNNAPLYFLDCSRVVVRGCIIEGISSESGIRVRNVTKPSRYVLLSGNHTSGSHKSGGLDSGQGSIGVYLDGPLSEPTKPYWLKNHRTPANPGLLQNVWIENHHDTGCYYGIGAGGVTGLFLTNNTVSYNMRGISVQDSSSLVRAYGNQVLENESAGIHLAYGVSDFWVYSNKVSSTRCHGEGMIQAYVGCSIGTVNHNTVESKSPLGAKYGLYTAINCRGVDFRFNSISGRFQRAPIACESFWDQNWKEPRHRAFNTKTEEGFASRDTGPIYMWHNNQPVLRVQGEGRRVLLDATDPVEDLKK